MKPACLILANIWFIVAVLSPNERLAVCGMILGPTYLAILTYPKKDKYETYPQAD